ncbi:fibroblast growth factor 22 [Bombina bombina]|uniref:fibroblast growth factor 22 n=1 Tax=Bombina bombina TaxID=8345 RepID=UPI00235AB436|nr:fibroblast growth factor 22 [Bombina bombina]
MSIKNTKGSPCLGTTAIAKAFRDYFEGLYNLNESDPIASTHDKSLKHKIAKYLDGIGIPSLSKEQQEYLDRPIQTEEITNVINHLPNEHREQVKKVLVDMCLSPLPAAQSICLTSCALLLFTASPVGSSDSQNRWIHNYKHLEGDVRWRRLFSATGFFLTIDRMGNVKGIRRYFSDSILQIHSVSVGIVAIHSVSSGVYLAMDRNGKVYGRKDYGPNCRFHERIEENGYHSYSSVRWRHHGHPMYLALKGNGMARRGSRTRRTHPSSHFLPLPI